MMTTNTITVSQLNTYVKSLIENDARLMLLNVSGEISNFKNHFSSGHWYFTLKDKDASIRCVMFRSSALRVRFNVEDGLAVVLKGRVSIYEKDGQYQFYAEEMHPLGEGDLALQFKQVKEKLEAEGLFDQSSKRPLVKFPKKIAVVTSDTGAAVRDIFNILNTRYPCCEVVMCPCLVQGDNAARDMINVLDRVYALDGIDTVIIGRGGGSAEDLHCFNDEALARKIYESPFPVISAVGHETDFTILDFVADLRAPTPSAAAELSVPDLGELKEKLEALKNRCQGSVKKQIDDMEFKVNSLKSRRPFLRPELVFAPFELRLDNATDKLQTAYILKIKGLESETLRLKESFRALSPKSVLERGFSVAFKEGKTVKSAKEIKTEDDILLKFSVGSAKCKVLSIDLEDN